MNDDARWTLRQLELLRARPEVISRALAAQERACVDVTLATDDARRVSRARARGDSRSHGDGRGVGEGERGLRGRAREMRAARALVERSRRKLIAAGFVDEGELVPFDPDA